MLSQWRRYINESEFEDLVDFVTNTKEGKKWRSHKFIYLYGTNQSLKSRLLNDIIKIIGDEDCKYCKPTPFKKTKIPKCYIIDSDDDNENYTDEEMDHIQGNNEECKEDDDDEDSECADIRECELYINKKLLIFNKKILQHHYQCAFIKEIVGYDKMFYYRPDGGCKLIQPCCNVIVDVNKRINIHRSLMMRAVIINLDVRE